MVLFGATRRLDRRDVCGLLGAPDAVTPGARNTVAWRYRRDHLTVTFAGSRVSKLSLVKVYNVNGVAPKLAR